jgi:predicted nucleic acid-binding protein
LDASNYSEELERNFPPQWEDLETLIATTGESLETEEPLDDSTPTLRLLQVQDEALEILQAFAARAKTWATIQGKLKSLAAVGVSDRDEVKLRHLQESFVQQLRSYDLPALPRRV